MPTELKDKSSGFPLAIPRIEYQPSDLLIFQSNNHRSSFNHHHKSTVKNKYKCIHTWLISSSQRVIFLCHILVVIKWRQWLHKPPSPFSSHAGRKPDSSDPPGNWTRKCLLDKLFHPTLHSKLKLRKVNGYLDCPPLLTLMAGLSFIQLNMISNNPFGLYLQMLLIIGELL